MILRTGVHQVLCRCGGTQRRIRQCPTAYSLCSAPVIMQVSELYATSRLHGKAESVGSIQAFDTRSPLSTCTLQSWAWSPGLIGQL